MREFMNLIENFGGTPDFSEAANSLYRDLPNNGLPSVRSYVRMEAGYEPWGSEEEIPDQDSLIREWCLNKVEEVYYEHFHHRIRTGKMEAWREITAAPGWSPDHWSHVGVYWCWKKGYAEAYWGDPKNHEGAGTQKYLIHALLPVDQIDWTATLMMNANPDYEEEYEVRLKKDSPVEIIDVEDKGPFHA